MSLIYLDMDTTKFEHDFLVTHCKRLQQKIAELEKERDEYHAMVVYTGGIMEASVGVAGWHLNGDVAEWDELFTVPLYKDALEAHNLEQQAIGIQKIIDCREHEFTPSEISTMKLIQKQLREGGDK